MFDDADTLLLASSDLSHYLDYEQAQRRDAETSARILAFANDLSGDQACGAVALNGVLSMSELAIVSSREARLKAMAKGGSSGAQCALQLSSNPGRFLSTVQIGITLVGILAGAYSGAALGGPVGERIALLGFEPETAETIGFAIVIVLTTFASVVITSTG